MKNKWLAATIISALLSTTAASGAMAFSDLEGVVHADKIMKLRDSGIVQGVGNNIFAPHEKITAQQAIPLIVKSMNLNLPDTSETPSANKIFTKIADDAWYAEAFVIAHMNGVPINADIDPNEAVTREQFIHWLMNALAATGDYAFIELYMMLEDEEQVSEGYMNSIQKALVSKIAELDEDGKFRPQAPITRAEAAIMSQNAIEFVETHKKLETGDPTVDPIKSGEVIVSTELVTDDVQKVTLSMGEKPHPGWSITIDRIDFPNDGTAVIHYSISYPDPAAMYPMVITYPKDETYLKADITNIQYELNLHKTEKANK